MKKTLKIDIINNIIRDCEIIEEVYPELTTTTEFEMLNIFRTEGKNFYTIKKYNKAGLVELSERLENKKAELIFA